jgi:hypothetical protein
MRAPNPALTGTTSVCHTRTCSASKFAQCSSSTASPASPANAPTWVHTVALYAPGSDITQCLHCDLRANHLTRIEGRCQSAAAY